MARRAHFANDPTDDRAASLTPRAMVKQEFGRRLQKILDDRNWTQADLARAVEVATGAKFGRDAVSTYINGRSAPTPASLNLLCKTLGMSRDELYPQAAINAAQDETPAFEMVAAAGHPGRAWVRINRMMSFEAATAIAQILSREDQEAPLP